MKKIVYIVILLLTFSCHKNVKNSTISGHVFGTSYAVKYHSQDNINYQKQFDSLFTVINKSMSTYQKDSDISKINKNEPTIVDVHFLNVFKASKEIYTQTDGIFDPTIGAVVNAWDFGPEGNIVALDSLKIDSLMQTVGFNNITVFKNEIVKNNPDTFLDFNAIAKGYGVDVIGEFLESKNITNYIVDIGGEIRAKGINVEKQQPWRVGVEEPHFDGTQSIMKTIELKDQAMATSGTYRKFKIDENGNRYSHIIDTKTGYPSKSNLLSISVIADNCMTADAYATAFKAMGIEKVTEFLKTHPELQVFLIYENSDGEFETLSLNGFPE